MQLRSSTLIIQNVESEEEFALSAFTKKTSTRVCMTEIVNAYKQTSAFPPSVSFTHAGECERSVNVISVWATVNTEICWSKHRLPIPDVTRRELKEQKINKVGVSLLRRRS